MKNDEIKKTDKEKKTDAELSEEDLDTVSGGVNTSFVQKATNKFQGNELTGKKI